MKFCCAHPEFPLRFDKTLKKSFKFSTLIYIDIDFWNNLKHLPQYFNIFRVREGYKFQKQNHPKIRLFLNKLK